MNSHHVRINLGLLCSLIAINSAIALPDLLIQDIWSSPSPLVFGEPYTLYARVLNQGDAEASAGFLLSQRVDFYLDGNKIGEASYDDVAAGNNVVVSLIATASASPFVSHQFRADADASNLINEGANEGNNSRTETWNITAPDLVVLDIWMTPTTPTNGQSCTLSVQIQNAGNATAPPCSLGIYRDGSFHAATGIPLLAGGQTTTVSPSITFPASGSITIRVEADVYDNVFESYENNNERSEIIVVSPGPILRLVTNSFSFGYSPNQQTLAIWNGGGGSFIYSLSANRPWIIALTNGICSTQTNYHTVSIDVSGLLIGTHTGLVAVASSAGTSNIAVSVNIGDGDGDQIPDGWETQYFGNVANCNPNLDSDNDGQKNRQEWIGGSNPTNKLSAFAISSVAIAPGGSNVNFHWPTLPSRLYDVFWSADVAGPFLPLGSNLPHTQTNYSDTTAPNAGFYRVNVKLE